MRALDANGNVVSRQDLNGDITTFLYDVNDGAFYFIEVNPRIQVEHTVTEEVTSVDIVKAQLRIAQGATLAELGLDRDDVGVPRGYAIQARANVSRRPPRTAARATTRTHAPRRTSARQAFVSARPCPATTAIFARSTFNSRRTAHSTSSTGTMR